MARSRLKFDVLLSWWPGHLCLVTRGGREQSSSGPEPVIKVSAVLSVAAAPAGGEIAPASLSVAVARRIGSYRRPGATLRKMQDPMAVIELFTRQRGCRQRKRGPRERSFGPALLAVACFAALLVPSEQTGGRPALATGSYGRLKRPGSSTGRGLMCFAGPYWPFPVLRRLVRCRRRPPLQVKRRPFPAASPAWPLWPFRPGCSSNCQTTPRFGQWATAVLGAGAVVTAFRYVTQGSVYRAR